MTLPLVRHSAAQEDRPIAGGSTSPWRPEEDESQVPRF